MKGGWADSASAVAYVPEVIGAPFPPTKPSAAVGINQIVIWSRRCPESDQLSTLSIAPTNEGHAHAEHGSPWGVRERIQARYIPSSAAKSREIFILSVISGVAPEVRLNIHSRFGGCNGFPRGHGITGKSRCLPATPPISCQPANLCRNNEILEADTRSPRPGRRACWGFPIPPRSGRFEAFSPLAHKLFLGIAFF